jgi:glucoamylase
MPRELILVNATLLATLDAEGAVADLTWPRPGLPDHLGGQRLRLAVALAGAGRAVWLGGPHCPLDVRSIHPGRRARLLGHIAESGLDVGIDVAVASRDPLLVRQILIRNSGRRHQALTLYAHHPLDIGGLDAGNGVVHVPDANSILHHHRACWIALGAADPSGRSFDHHSCRFRGEPAPGGLAGCIERGEVLDRNPVSLGRVDSAMAFDLELAPGAETRILLWLVFGASERAVLGLHRRAAGGAARQILSEGAPAAPALPELGSLPPAVAETAGISTQLLAAFGEAPGPPPAAVDSSTLDPGRESYAYVWPRDGAFIAEIQDRIGIGEATDRFLDFAARVLPLSGAFDQRYQVDGTKASSWHPRRPPGDPARPVQADETGLVLWALDRRVRRGAALDPAWRHLLLLPAAAFLVAYRDADTGLPLPCHDLWEERFGVHAFTVAATIAGLRGAARLLAVAGDPGPAARAESAARAMDEALDRHLLHPRTGLYARALGPQGLDPTPDASLLGLVLLDVREAQDPRMAPSIEHIARALASPRAGGGIARYAGDRYAFQPDADPSLPGNPWILTTCWLAEVLCRRDAPGDRARALDLLGFAVRARRPSGLLPEQVHPASLRPESACPLLWSHAAFLSATLAAVRR